MKVTPKIGNNCIQCDHIISLLIRVSIIILLASINNYFDKETDYNLITIYVHDVECCNFLTNYISATCLYISLYF